MSRIKNNNEKRNSLRVYVYARHSIHISLVSSNQKEVFCNEYKVISMVDLKSIEMLIVGYAHEHPQWKYHDFPFHWSVCLNLYDHIQKFPEGRELPTLFIERLLCSAKNSFQTIVIALRKIPDELFESIKNYLNDSR